MTASARRTFGPVVLLGLLGGGVVAFGGTRSWVEVDGATGAVSGLGQSGLATTADLGEVPLAGALGLVVLACWGVVLVTRGWVRRGVAAAGAVAALGALASAVHAARTLVDGVRDELARGGAVAGDPTSVDLNLWWPVCAAGALLAAAAFVAAVRLAPGWPEMGSRYDAPTGGTAAKEPETSLDIWRAIDDGDDPTR